MRWATFTSTIDGLDHVGLLVDHKLHALSAETTLLGLLTDDTFAAAAYRAMDQPVEIVDYSVAKLVAPLRVPPSIRDFMSFETHVVTSMAAIGGTVDPVWYEQPTFYFTNPAAVVGPRDVVSMAPGTAKWDFELEVAAVIGVAGGDIPLDEAESHIAGYTIMCDWSARDHQERESRVGLGPAKGKDTATTLGPLLVSPDELEPYRSGRGYDLTMSVNVNGRPYSLGNWSTLFWSFPQMVAYASRGTELRPGDVIGSGTVGTGCILELSRVHGSEAFPWLVAGDLVEVSVEQLGSFESTVVSGSDPVSFQLL